jgi:metallophosphoesterase superfamily enzyme
VHDPRIEPPASASADSYLLGGHVHPTVALTGRGRPRVRLPCFVLGARAGILPAFASFTGGGMYSHHDGDQLFAIADERVIPL